VSTADCCAARCGLYIVEEEDNNHSCWQNLPRRFLKVSDVCCWTKLMIELCILASSVLVFFHFIHFNESNNFKKKTHQLLQAEKLCILRKECLYR
jgi:hypothetical protein